MATKRTIIKLDCGVEAETCIYSGMEWLKISLIDLYNGYGELNSLPLLSKMFSELSLRGFTSSGTMRVEGYYGATDDLLLEVSRKI